MSASGISINPAVYAKLPYDAVNDFVAVSELASFPLIMIVAANSPIKSVAELVAYRQSQSGQDELWQLVRLVPARHRTVQAEDRRADAGHSLQERQ